MIIYAGNIYYDNTKYISNRVSIGLNKITMKKSSVTTSIRNLDAHSLTYEMNYLTNPVESPHNLHHQR